MEQEVAKAQFAAGRLPATIDPVAEKASRSGCSGKRIYRPDGPKLTLAVGNLRAPNIDLHQVRPAPSPQSLGYVSRRRRAASRTCAHTLW